MSRPAPHVGFVIGGLLVLQIATTMALNAPTVLGPVMLADFGLAPRLLGFFVAALLCGAMVSSLLAGLVVRRLGPLRASQAGALLMAFAMLCAASGSPALLLIAIVLMGLGVGPITPSSSQLLAQVSPLLCGQMPIGRRVFWRRILGLRLAGVWGLEGRAQFGAPLLVGQVRQHLPWPFVFLGAALLIAASQLTLLGLPNAAPLQASGGTIREGWAYVRRTPIVLQLLIASAVAHLLMGPIQVIMPRYLDAALHLDPGARGAFLALAAPSLITGGLIALSLKRLAHPGRALMAGVVASALLCALLASVTALPLAVLVFAGACVLAGSAVAFLAASLQDVSEPALRGRIMASYAITTQFFPALSGLICGLLLAWQGPIVALASYAIGVSAVAVTAAALMAELRRYRRGAPPL